MFEVQIKIAANSVGELRKADVFRVLEQNADVRDSLAAYISEQRPDLADEVSEIMAEEFS